ncbi:hypothetical protein HYT53_03680 [Candidatus Woesearchaeota archaeon]|nr:hypothetical protein [Candidatus Woesearchaeota archaeon]
METNCVSYENLMGSLREISRSKHVNPTMHHYADESVKFLQKHPKTSELLEEALSNTPCKDIAEIVQRLAAGRRDLVIADEAIKLEKGLSFYSREIEKAANMAANTVEGVGIIVGTEISSSWKSFKENVYYGATGAGVLAALVLAALAVKWYRK